MKAIWNDAVIAESDDTVVVEGNHYFPRGAVKEKYLAPSDTHTTCGWKGVASYHDLVVDGQTNKDAAWFYPQAKPEAAKITDRIAFWKGVKIVD